MTATEILKELKEGKITEEQAANLLNKSKVTLKVSQKGGIQIDGLRRFPITLYRSEYETISSMAEEIKAFIEANKSRLATKGE